MNSEFRGRLTVLVGSLGLAILPALSFCVQLIFSKAIGREALFWRHPTVVILDWIFVPFNFLVFRAIDWRRGAALYVLVCVAIALNALTHSYWQTVGADPGHMISHGVMLPAGWTHLVFSSCETSLLLAWAFIRRSDARDLAWLNGLASVYFAMLFVLGYVIHGRILPSDAIAAALGLLVVVILPSTISLSARSND